MSARSTAPAIRKRDGGFTIFYMGVNLGAAIAPLLCGYIGETYGWHWGFGLATFGMLVGVATFVAPRTAAQILIYVHGAAAPRERCWFIARTISSRSA